MSSQESDTANEAYVGEGEAGGDAVSSKESQYCQESEYCQLQDIIIIH